MTAMNLPVSSWHGQNIYISKKTHKAPLLQPPTLDVVIRMSQGTLEVFDQITSFSECLPVCMGEAAQACEQALGFLPPGSPNFSWRILPTA